MKNLILLLFTISLFSCRNRDLNEVAPPIIIDNSGNLAPCDWITTVFPPESFDLEQLSSFDLNGVVEFRAIDENIMYVLGDKESTSSVGLVKTEDGGNSWLSLPNNIKSHPRSMFFKNKDEGFITVHDVTGCPPPNCLNRCVLYKTVDGGVSWEEKIYPELKGILYDIQFDAEGNAYTLLSFDGTVTLMKSTDDAESWNTLYAAANLDIASTLFSFTLFEDKIYTITKQGEILKLDTEGTLLASLEIDPILVWGVHVIDEENIIVTGIRGALKTNDGGQTWSSIHDQSTRIIKFNTPEEGLVVFNKSGCPTDVYQVNDVIAYTKDGGQTWEESEITTNLVSNYSNSQLMDNGDIFFIVEDMFYRLYTN